MGLGGRPGGRVRRDPLRARAADRRTLDHGRRARLLRAREELRRRRPLPAPGRAHRRLRARVPRAAQPGVGAVRPRPAGLRRGEGDQRGDRLAGGDPRLPARPPRLLTPVRLRGGRAGDVGADAALRRDADDRERVLPGVPARSAGDGRLVGATRPAPHALRDRGVRARLPDPRAGRGDPAGAGDRSLPRLRPEGAARVPLVLRGGRRGGSARPGRPGRARRLDLRRVRRLRGRRPHAVHRRRRLPLVALPLGGADPLARRRAVRRARRVGADGAWPAAPGARLPGRGRDALVLACAARGDVRVRAVAPRRGAEHVLRRTALPDRADALGRARLPSPLGGRRPHRRHRRRRRDRRCPTRS